MISEIKKFLRKSRNKVYDTTRSSARNFILAASSLTYLTTEYFPQHIREYLDVNTQEINEYSAKILGASIALYLAHKSNLRLNDLFKNKPVLRKISKPVAYFGLANLINLGKDLFIKTAEAETGLEGKIDNGREILKIGHPSSSFNYDFTHQLSSFLGELKDNVYNTFDTAKETIIGIENQYNGSDLELISSVALTGLLLLPLIKVGANISKDIYNCLIVEPSHCYEERIRRKKMLKEIKKSQDNFD